MLSPSPVLTPPDVAGDIEVSVVMPCLNEACTVGRCVVKARSALEALGIAGEVVVADNGSTDGSQDLARAEGARVVHAERKGYGNALQAGIAAARGRFVIMGDADDSYDFTQLEPFVARLRQGDDLVMGNRFQGGIQPGAMPWMHRYVGNPVLTGVLNLFFHSPIGDAHCGLRGFRKDACLRLGLNAPGMEFASEMVVKACLHGQKISEVPICLYPDGRDRRPHLRSFRDGWRHLRFLLLLCPMWLYLIPAGLLLGSGLGLMVWLTPGPQEVGGVVLDVHTMLLGALLVILGYQTLGLWACAKIYGWTHGLLPARTFSFRLFDLLNLERGLLAGAALFLLGLGLNLRLVFEWRDTGLGALDVQHTMRYTLWGFTAMVLGVQTVYGSFFLSMLGMSGVKGQEAGGGKPDFVSMVPFFTTPVAFAALAGLPALAAIYWLRNRSRRYPVSSLMLWVDHKQVREGGRRVERFRAPLLFFLELLAILLLVGAAAGPSVHSTYGTRPLVVVLDDSFSMLAGGADSPRGRGVKAVEEEIRRMAPYSVRFILAGDRPQALGEPARTPREASLLLEGWKCKAPSAHLDEAVALASELGGERALLLVVTDHAPTTEPDTGRLRWWAFGRSRFNLAFVNAARTSRDGPERCLFEIANLSPEGKAATLVIEADDPAVELQRSALRFGPQETRRVVLELKENTPALRARIGEDDLEIDNQVTLMPGGNKTVRVQLEVQNDVLRPLVEKAVKATKGTSLVRSRPDILFTDRQGGREADESWVVELFSEKEAEAYAGPFVVDRAHPLTEGLSLQGVIWGAGKAEKFPGAPVVTAGNVPLLTDTETLSSRHRLRLRLRPDLSTLQGSPNWPILMWNLVQWHASLGPGLSRPNVRLGEETTLTLPGDVDVVQVVGPDGQSRKTAVQNRRVTAAAEEVGVYEFRAGETTYTFASNALRRDESDLTACATGRWGEWLEEHSSQVEAQSIAWVLLLVALAVLSVHMLLATRGPAKVRT